MSRELKITLSVPTATRAMNAPTATSAALVGLKSVSISIFSPVDFELKLSLFKVRLRSPRAINVRVCVR